MMMRDIAQCAIGIAILLTVAYVFYGKAESVFHRLQSVLGKHGCPEGGRRSVAYIRYFRIIGVLAGAFALMHLVRCIIDMTLRLLE